MFDWINWGLMAISFILRISLFGLAMVAQVFNLH
jgi:hypothetical protein